MVHLAQLHSFALNYSAQQFLQFEQMAVFRAAAKRHQLFEQEHYILGDGTNTVFCQDFAGSIIQLKNQELEISERADDYLLTVGAGYNWHQLVNLTIQKGIYGLENLALIPGTVGAAPIQNIGAYGMELSQLIEFVEFLDKSNLHLERLASHELSFAYRDSIFKQSLHQQVVITRVGLSLAKRWQPNVSYQGLEGLTQPQQIYNKVISLRQSKLPDIKKKPNAGSFFKNPVITFSHFNHLKQKYQSIPGYNVRAGIKLSAAWLIEHCGFKGKRYGGVAVSPQHSLVLINEGGGTGSQLCALVTEIINQVKQVFAIHLAVEVRMVGCHRGSEEIDE